MDTPVSSQLRASENLQRSSSDLIILRLSQNLTFEGWIFVRGILNVIGLTLALTGVAKAEFSYCNFNFGVDFQQHSTAACGYPGCSQNNEILLIPSGIDFTTMFVGKKQVGATTYAPGPTNQREGAHIVVSKALGTTPVWLMYVIAFGAKLKLNVEDCNNGGGLCSVGAKYIRDNRADILAQYNSYAHYVADGGGSAKYAWGTTKPIIWQIEPDFYQYTAGSQTNPLSYAEAKQLLTDIATTVRSVLPNVWLAMDVSTWANAGWWSSAIPYDKFNFMGTSGGVASPGGTIKDGMTWAALWNSSKKGIISDDGYGVGGAPTTPNAGWVDVNNLNARIADGVIANWRAIGNDAWAAQVAKIRPQLKPLKVCADQPPSGVLKPKDSSPLQLMQNKAGITVDFEAQAGSLRAEIVGLDGAFEKVLQTTQVPAGSFHASYSMEGLRPGIHVLRVVNKNREVRATTTVVR